MKIISIAITALCFVQVSAFAPSPLASRKRVTQSSQAHTASPILLRMAADSGSPFDFFSGLFPKQNKAPVVPEKPRIPDIIVDSDYTLSYVFGAIGIFIILTSPDTSCLPGSTICPPSIWGVVQGGLNVLFASFLAVQAKRIRFVFDSTSFELKNVDIGASDDEVLKESGENFVVGGANRWDYDTFVNYDFFPNEKFPVLVYFKETQTPTESWEEGPGSFDKVGGGQIHFFPAIANVKQLKEQFEIRGCAKADIK